MAWQVRLGGVGCVEDRHVMVWQARLGEARFVMARLGKVWFFL